MIRILNMWWQECTICLAKLKIILEGKFCFNENRHQYKLTLHNFDNVTLTNASKKQKYCLVRSGEASAPDTLWRRDRLSKNILQNITFPVTLLRLCWPLFYFCDLVSSGAWGAWGAVSVSDMIWAPVGRDVSGMWSAWSHIRGNKDGLSHVLGFKSWTIKSLKSNKMSFKFSKLATT